MELHSDIFITNVIDDRQRPPAFVVQIDTSYLAILPYKSSARIYLPVTKSVLQAK